MAPGKGELEVLVPLGVAETGTPPPRPPPPPDGEAAGVGAHRRRWPVLAFAVVVVAAGIAVPVRDRLARSELRWLDRQWARAVGDDGERITAEHQLNAYGAVTDPVELNADLSALYHEEHQRFVAAVNRVNHALLVDPGLSGLRGDIAAALQHRADLLAAVAAWYGHPGDGPAPVNADDQTAADAVGVDNALRAGRARWHQPQPAATATAAHYSTVTAALVHLARWLDQPTGAVLISGSVSGDHLERLDVDASRVIPTGVPANDGNPVPRQGYLAYASEGQIWAVAPDGSGAPRRLARGDWVFAAVDPGALWVGDSTTFKVTEVDGSGRVLLGPVLPPGDLRSATPAGLVVTGQQHPGIELWNPADGSLRCPNLVSSGDGGPLVLATWGNLLAWASSDGLHLSDAATCVDHSLPMVNATQGDLQGVATFSPDGRTLAVATYHHDPQGQDSYPLELVDVASAQLSAAPVPEQHGTEVPVTQFFGAPISAIAWTPDGTRLFWVFSGLFGSTSLIETWRVGDPVAKPLRAVGLALTPPLYVVP